MFFDNSNLFSDNNGFLLTAVVRRIVQRSLEVRRGSAIGCLGSGLADGSALLLHRWRGVPR